MEHAGSSTFVRTGDTQWSYAASFPPLPDIDLDTAVNIRLTVEVTAGTIGVGCLDAAGSAFIDQTLVPVTQAPTVVDLVVTTPREVGALVVRNGSPDGPSEARISNVQCYGVDDSDSSRQPGLSDPHPMPRWNRYYGANGDTPVERLRALRFANLRQPTRVHWVDGLTFAIQPNDQLSRAVYVSGTYEPNTLCVIRGLLEPGGVFFDVGANAGIISLAAAAWVGASGRVFSFEASQREFTRLTETVAINGLSHVFAVRAAVADREGRADLRVAEAACSGLNTLGERFAYDVETDRIESVETITLDRFVSERAIDRVDVMKIDVEGAEGAVLTGSRELLAEHRPALVIEVFSASLAANGWNRSALERLLRDARYGFYSIDEGSAGLVHLATLEGADEQNVVALPLERADAAIARMRTSK